MGTTGATRILQLSVFLGVFVDAAFFFTGSHSSKCDSTVDSLDLSYLLWWSCSLDNPNTTYTVQTKQQGEPWLNVTGCVRVSSPHCDLTRVFPDLNLYHLIRLGLHVGPQDLVWTEPRSLDHEDFIFSPPSVSVSLDKAVLVVEVQFPCSASRRCSLRSCCPVSEFIDPWTTITVYNQLNLSQYQRRTVWTLDVVAREEFSDLAAGQVFCAVANFSLQPRSFTPASSPSSPPQCVPTAPRPGYQQPVWVWTGVSCALLFPPLLLLLVLLRRTRTPDMTEELPKALVSLYEPVSTDAVHLSDVHLEVLEDRMSILSSSAYVNTDTQEQASSLGDECILSPLS
ncbi:uncharacterized protein si:dkeyp-75h12.7 [Osmerus eperlanus]|uniref:uncharacterized protein si:dkeyp-75h12.7 n=1 Tax=Osmerus eperlanus TaxID=29151 RepID=UPI002E118BC5